MIRLSLGSHGDEVRQVEHRLQDLLLYSGAVDGLFGGGVQSAVKQFQRANSLPVDGVVGPETWAALFPGAEAPAAVAIAAQPIARRCLALTGAFETSTPIPDCYCGLTGNFDGQGISFGVLQWNFGQGTLQPLLNEIVTSHPDVAAAIFQEDLATLTAVLSWPRERQLQWAASIQDPRRFRIFEPWRGFFRALGRTSECQDLQVKYADRTRQTAQAMCRDFGVRTERALALMFDICVQNGSIRADAAAAIRADFARLPSGDALALEVPRLRSIANRRAEAASPAFVEDVRVRKLTIANGEGTVHNVAYNLDQQFGIRLEPYAGS